jgi:hypothetical protein
MMERSTRASPSRANPSRAAPATPRPDGRARQATKRKLSLRSALWGGLTVVLITFLAWFVLWANEAGGILP